MHKILITGATGNVGMALIQTLVESGEKDRILAAVRSVENIPAYFVTHDIKTVAFDLTDQRSFASAFEGCGMLFLMRPPQIAAVDTYFKPLMDALLVSSIKHIVFLSVQGVEKSSFIPHHGIEKLIVQSGLSYTFLRASYFMQNFTGNLQDDLMKDRIFLPAGSARFTLVDVRDIGRVAAHVFIHVQAHAFKSYDITGSETVSFKEMAKQLSEGLGRNIQYQSPGLLRFYWEKRKAKIPLALILVMILLHFLPRFQKPTSCSEWVKKITGKDPVLFEQFIADHRGRWKR